MVITDGDNITPPPSNKGEQTTALVRAAQTAPVPSSEQDFEKWRSQFWWASSKKLIREAIKQNKQDHLNYLIGQGKGRCELHKAVRANDLKAIKMLLVAGVDVDESDEYGDTPLIIAAICNHYKAGELLLEADADINAQGCYDRTPLICCSLNGHHGFCELLLRYNPNPTMTDSANEKFTARQWAENKGHQSVFNILTAYEEWRAQQMPPSLPTPPVAQSTAQDGSAYSLPPGWSIVMADEVQMAIRTIHDDASKTTIKDIFDFNAGRLLTAMKHGPDDSYGAPLEKDFKNVKAEFLAQARATLDQATAHRAEVRNAAQPSNLRMT